MKIATSEILKSPLLAAASLCLVIASSPAWAQGLQTTRLIGTITRVNGPTLVVKTATSEKEVHVAADTPLFALAKASMADVKPGVFVGVGATPQADDSQQAIRVMIFPESMRGLGEGHRPWDKPGTTMTNATVDTSIASVNGQVAMVKYKGGEKKIIIRPDAQIVTYVVAGKNEVKPGANVTISGTATAGGVIEASRIVVSRDGIALN